MLSQSQNKKKYLNETITMSIVSLNLCKGEKKRRKKRSCKCLYLLLTLTGNAHHCLSPPTGHHWKTTSEKNQD